MAEQTERPRKRRAKDTAYGFPVQRGLTRDFLSEQFCEDFAALIASGLPDKLASLKLGVPPGKMRHWLATGEQQAAEALSNPDRDHTILSWEGRLWRHWAAAAAYRDGSLLENVTEPGAVGDGSKWKLERFDPEQFRPGQKVEITAGHQIDRSQLEGGPTLGEIAEFLRGVRGDNGNTGTVGAGETVPRPRALLPAPGDG